MKFNAKNSMLLVVLAASFGCGENMGKIKINQTSNPVVTNPNVNLPDTGTTQPLTGLPAEEYTAGPIIYRSNNGNDFLFSLSEVEGPKAGYYPDEARFGTLSVGTGGTTPLFRCLSTGTNRTHFLSTATNCEGHTNEGSLGNVSTTAKAGLVPLVRWVHLKSSLHIAVVPSEKIDFTGWKQEGTLGYVTEIRIPSVVKTPDDGKKYFGYYAGAMDGVGSGDYISELWTSSNLIFIKSAGNFEAKLADCERRGVKAVITFDWLFLDNEFRLKSDYKEKFKAVEPIIQRYSATIAAFYGLDEPYANSAARGVSAAETYNAQETMGRFLKSKFPTIPIGVIFTTGEVKTGNRLFPSFDWFGFDCYNAEMECGGQSVSWYFNKLSTMMNEATVKDGKKRYLMAVPQSGHPVSDGSKKGEKDILAQLPGYRQIVRNNSNIKVVMPFLWQTFNDGSANWIGTREIPNVKAQYLLFYQDFIRGTL